MIPLTHLICLFMGLLYLLITMKLLLPLRHKSACPLRHVLTLLIFVIILAPLLLSFFWKQMTPALTAFMLPSVMTALFLAFPGIYKTPEIDLQNPKQRKAFAQKQQIRL